MLADDLAYYLSSGGLGTVGTSVFWDELPDNAATGVVVADTGGIFPVHTMSSGPSGIGTAAARLERPRVQVMSRAPTYASARALIQDAFNLLDGLQDRTLNGVRYAWVSAVQSPFSMGRDKNNRSRFACNFDVVKAVSTSSST